MSYALFAMETDMENEALLEILAKMGAKEIEYTNENGDSDVISFEFKGKRVEIVGRWQMDGTGGIYSTVVGV